MFVFGSTSEWPTSGWECVVFPCLKTHVGTTHCSHDGRKNFFSFFRSIFLLGRILCNVGFLTPFLSAATSRKNFGSVMPGSFNMCKLWRDYNCVIEACVTEYHFAFHMLYRNEHDVSRCTVISVPNFLKTS